MDLTILNENLETIAVFDEFESVIWTDRYQKHGDFEIYTPVSKKLLECIRQDYYIINQYSDRVMIVEKIKIDSDVEEGNRIIVSGRSLESILDRRIVWGLQTVRGKMQDCVEKIFDVNIISPKLPERKIPRFVFKKIDDELLDKVQMKQQFTGDNIYEIVTNICKQLNIGFKITLTPQNQFQFEFYRGEDRTYDQFKNPFVIFSPKFENIISSNYIESKSAWKNTTLIAGEGEGVKRRYAAIGKATGLNRRELFVDARDISSDAENEKKISDEEYNLLLLQRGYEKLAENTRVLSFDGQVETTSLFKYGEDFFIGDIIQIEDEYGHETTSRIQEMIISEDREGFKIYPTFKRDEEV